MARGIVGIARGRPSPTVASPMYKQVFDLATGECLDEPGARVPGSTRPRRRRAASRSGLLGSGCGGAVSDPGPAAGGLPDPGHLRPAVRRAGRCFTRRGAAVLHAPTLRVVPLVEDAELSTRRAVIANPPDDVIVTTASGSAAGSRPPTPPGWHDDLLPALGGSDCSRAGRRRAVRSRRPGCGQTGSRESETTAEVVELAARRGRGHQRIAVQLHGAGDDGLHDRLAGGGAAVRELEVYRWGPPPDPALLSATSEELADGGFDAVLFTSAPGAAAWLDELRRPGGSTTRRELAAAGGLLVAAVGPVTAEPLQVAASTWWCPDRWRMGALVRLVIMELGGCGGIETPAGLLQVRAGAATLDHRVLALSPSGLAVLRRLARAPGEVVSRESCCACCPATPRPARRRGRGRPAARRAGRRA